MRFKAKLELWFIVIIAATPIAIINLVAVIITGASVMGIIFCAIALLGSIFLISVGVGITYVLTDTSLIIESGRLSKTQEILYRDIESVTMTKSGRLMIKYLYRKRTLTGLLWVVEKDEFLKQIQEKAGNVFMRSDENKGS